MVKKRSSNCANNNKNRGYPAACPRNKRKMGGIRKIVRAKYRRAGWGVELACCDSAAGRGRVE